MNNIFNSTKLKDYTIKIGSGVTPRGGQAVYIQEGIPFIRSQNVRSNRLDLSDVVFIDAQQHKKMKSSTVLQNDVLLNITGASIGRSCVVPSGINEANVNQHVCIIRLKKSYDPYFLSTFLNSFYGQKQILSFQSGGSREGLNYDQIGTFKIPSMSLPEQKTIADILSTWYLAIEKTEKLIAENEKRFKWLLNELIPKKAKKEGWKQVTLGDIGITYSGLTGKSKNDFGEGKPYIPYLNIYQNCSISLQQLDYVKIKETENQNLVKKGDVFFTVSSETADEVGISSVLLENLGECYLNSFCFGWRQKKDEFYPEYLQYYFRSSEFREKVLSLAQGATRYNLSKNELMKLKIPHPTKEKQKEISIILCNLRKEIEYRNNLLEKYKYQKQGLMQKLLTGQWRVKI